MPRVRPIPASERYKTRRGLGPLVTRLAEELRRGGETSQPMIIERAIGRTETIHATVIWDEWARTPGADRMDVILAAYAQAEGDEAGERVALASGYTVPEATEGGLLPYRILTALRKDDPVTAEQCRQALVDEGASVLVSPDHPQLRFSTEEEAEAACKRLAARLPGSEPVWLVTQDYGPYGPVEG